MKTFKFMACAALSMLALSFGACSEEDKTEYAVPGKFGEMTLEPETAYTHRYVKVTVPYQAGQHTTDEKIYHVLPSGIEYPCELKDGKVAFLTSFTDAGTQKIKLVCHFKGISKDGQYTVETTKDVQVLPTDFRCHMWHETASQTEANLKYYTSLQKNADGSWSIRESDTFGNNNYASEVTGTGSQRSVAYLFDENECLSSVLYDADIPATLRPDSYVSYMVLRTKQIQKEFDLGQYTYQMTNPAFSLTSEEQATVESTLRKLNNAEVPTTEERAELGRLILDKGLAFYVPLTSKNGKTAGKSVAQVFNGKFKIVDRYEALAGE